MVDVTVPVQERAVFEIELTKGDALVRWFKDDVELQFSEHIQLAIDGKRQRLMIYNSDRADEGVYSCTVGDDISEARLTVEGLICPTIIITVFCGNSIFHGFLFFRTQGTIPEETS